MFIPYMKFSIEPKAIRDENMLQLTRYVEEKTKQSFSSVKLGTKEEEMVFGPGNSSCWLLAKL